MEAKKLPTSIRRMNTLEIGWVAGIIEGEGNFYGTETRMTIRVSMTDADIISRLNEITGVGKISEEKLKGLNRKPLYRWEVLRENDVLHLLLTIWPLLSIRRKLQAQTMLEKRGI